MSIGYFLSLNIFLIEVVSFKVCFIFLIFLVNKITPQGLYLLKNNFSLEESFKDFIPTIKDRLLNLYLFKLD